MSWWGKLAGGAFGFIVGGPLGALLGVVLGHTMDRGLQTLQLEQELPPGDRERVQTAFFTATFSVMGRVAKADGRITKDEIVLAEAIMSDMELSTDMRRLAIDLFQQGKAEDFPLEEIVNQFRRECHRRVTLIQMFVEIQLQAAYADGVMDPAEEALLLSICEQLGVPDFLFRRLERMVHAEYQTESKSSNNVSEIEAALPTLENAYAILSVSSHASDAEVKKAFRRLTNQHHPDKLVAKGLPEEMMKIAAHKTHEIRKAYEKIKAVRGL